MLSINFIAIILSFLISVITVPLMIKISNKFNLFDSTGGRKIHTGNISRLGGIGILLGFMTSMILLAITKEFEPIKQNIWFCIPAFLIIISMGVIDDIKTLNAKVKFILQIVATIFVLIGGFRFKFLQIGSYSLNLGFLGYPLTFVWILGVTNAINLIDGLDGLSGSIGIISAFTISFFAFFKGETEAALLSICLCASILGFLVYNLPLPKAKIFMGDGGSQFLGFILAILPLFYKGECSYISLPSTAALLLIPIFDTFAAIWRRLREHRKIGSPDKFHIHHKLLLLGFSKRVSLLIVIILQCLISMLLVLSVKLDVSASILLVFSIYLMGTLFFSIIHIGKTQALKKLANEENEVNKSDSNDLSEN